LKGEVILKITVDKSQIEGILNQLNTVGEIINQLKEATKNNAEFQVFGKYAAIVFGNTIDVLVASGELVQNLSDLCRLSNELYGYVITKATNLNQSGEPVEINIFNLKSSLQVPQARVNNSKVS
jgi:hypothetical protein